MCSVVLWQHEEPTKTIQIAVVGVAGRRFGIRLSRELGKKPSGRSHGFAGQGVQACSGDAGGGRPRLPGRARRGTLCQAQPDEGNPSLHDKEVCRHLTEPPVVVQPLGEVGVRRLGDATEESVTLGGRAIDEQADGLPEPFGPVGRVVDDP